MQHILKLVYILLLISISTHASDSILRPENVAVVVNVSNHKSVEVGQYYLKQRQIPLENLIQVDISGSPKKLNVDQFNALKQQITDKLRPDIQVILLVWTAPYAVECNSITAALTLGYDATQCQNTCGQGKVSPYFSSGVKSPAELGLQLAMLMPTESVDETKLLIDRGMLSAFNVNEASGYFLNTSDKNRSSRAIYFPRTVNIPEKKLHLFNLNMDTIEDKKDVMFYHTGLAHVSHLETLHFMPGALADHLTSTGGDLLDSGQMSILKWLKAGATASYGTVSEPCNYWQKFPNSTVLLKHYLSGETAIEAYWKSVKWPTQGLFIGEPLAAPYCRYCKLR